MPGITFTFIIFIYTFESMNYPLSMNRKMIYLMASALLFILLQAPIKAQMDTEPLPYGGNALMMEFICDEMTYPPAALENKTEGTVKIGLTVLENGNPLNYRVLEGISPELDREAMRICKLIMFRPAVKSTNNIIADVIIPVRFNIKKYNRNLKNKGFDRLEPYRGPTDTSMIIYTSNQLNKLPVPVFEKPGMTFSRFIMDHIRYPEEAFRLSISGEVVLGFVVETSGRISNIEVIRPLGGGCTEEAIQLIRKIKWEPGILNGLAVRTMMNASIGFSLKNDAGHHYLPNYSSGTM
jgi:TonB family protein